MCWGFKVPCWWLTTVPVCVCLAVRRPREQQASAGRHCGAPQRHPAGHRRLPVWSVQQSRQHPGERQRHGHEWVSQQLQLFVSARCSSAFMQNNVESAWAAAVLLSATFTLPLCAFAASPKERRSYCKILVKQADRTWFPCNSCRSVPHVWSFHRPLWLPVAWKRSCAWTFLAAAGCWCCPGKRNLVLNFS